MADKKELTYLVAGDLHHQAKDRDALLCSHALSLFNAFICSYKILNPVAILQVGDLIDGYHLPLDICKRDLDEVTRILRASPVPVHAIIGNHETVYLPDRPHLLKALGIEAFSRVINTGPLRVILFDVTVDGASHGDLTPERARWLESAVLAPPEKPVLLIQHPLIHPDENVCSHRHYVRNSGDYRRLLGRLPQVMLVLTGHRHIPDRVCLTPERPSSAQGRIVRDGPLFQITLGCLCAWPFTFGQIAFDPDARRLTFRERALEEGWVAPNPASGVADFPALLEFGRRLRVEERPEVWASRPRLTPGLAEVTITWSEAARRARSGRR